MKIQKMKSLTQLSAKLSMYPSILTCHLEKETHFENETSTYYGFCLAGKVQLAQNKSGYVASITVGMYFSATGPFTLSGSGKVFIVERIGYRGLFTLGGPVEEDGRLIYIDNCKSTLLIPPARLGDPVFNLLVFPPNTKQSMHIHPTVRFGAVFKGNGICHASNKKIALPEKSVFMIEPGEQHRFETNKVSMVVIAYHPDSDVGPTDSAHPMLSRTYLSK